MVGLLKFPKGGESSERVILKAAKPLELALAVHVLKCVFEEM